MSVNGRRRPVVAGVDYSSPNPAAMTYAASESGDQGRWMVNTRPLVPTGHSRRSRI